MIVHLYAQCWNDERMLPFFFRHYDPIVDRYFMYDDGSEDRTLEILAGHGSVTVERFPRSDPGSFVLSEQSFSNEAWKQSRGQADWIVFTDVDEHLVHPGFRDFLGQCVAGGVSLVPALGFQMISDRFPSANVELSANVRRGAPWKRMMKSSVFNPNRLSEINFEPGRHMAAPEGQVVVPTVDETVLLHFKYLGFEETLERHRMLGEGLGPVDRGLKWGHKYSWSEEELRSDWEAVQAAAVDWRLALADPGWRYPLPRWWHRYRK